MRLADDERYRQQELYESAREVRATAPKEADVLIREALSLWRGRPYADVEAHGYLDWEITRLSELRLAAQGSPG
ncbi:MAG TPA: BTAD domain-containing putative transcriptional regulator, partial [Acidimicrobiia bacterium]|nr:BTAD domain-containing putative transcriptional regulator [Acidimicrobiia bacterium]